MTAGTAWLLLAAYAWMSLATFLAFAWDKRCARLGKRRVPERTLHLLELFGGWPGALAGQSFLRHKSVKLSYRVVLWVIVVLHVAGWGVFVYLRARTG
ncbi:MAG: DUF1294 domain-containing protein [Planctomycetes bacterium]|nr:DUF1294 domain-containing protein [Planctomycetota bacterium]